MATLTIREASSVLPSPQEIMREGRYSQFPNLPYRSQSSRDAIELPSIRQAVPEIELGSTRSESSDHSSDPASYSPTVIRNLENPPEYNQIELLNKRRRVSSQDGRGSELGDYPTQRKFPSPQQIRAQTIALPPAERHPSGYFAGESWNPQDRESSYRASTLPALRSPSKYESSANEFRPTLPSLPSLTLDHRPPNARSGASWSEYPPDAPWSTTQGNFNQSSSIFPRPPSVSSGSQQSEYFTYDNIRNRSYSGPPLRDHQSVSEQSSFASRNYYSERLDIGDMSGIEATKHRKRRGNLPKETTDKLRAWFVAHLHHPYPTEDEKQELMKQTRLQMNQISNWFINARRRQLPAMINNARVESDARSGSTAEGALRSDDFSEQDRHNSGSHLTPESGGSEGGYEDDVDSPEQLKRSEPGTGLDRKIRKG